MEIRTMLIVAAVTCCAVALTTGTLTYKYTSQHYELQIKDEHLKQQTELAKANAKVVEKERENNEITANLNEQALASSKAISDMQTKLSAMRTPSGGVRVSATCDKPTTNSTDTAPGGSQPASATAASGVCLLSGEFTDFLAKVTFDADTLRSRVLICQEYAEAIDKQRKEMYNSKD